MDATTPWNGFMTTSDIDRWRCNRKLLNPCFHFGILKDFMSEFNYHTRKLIKLLRGDIEEDFTDISAYITLCSQEIINGTVLGIRLDDLKISGYENMMAMRQSQNAIVKRMMTWWKWPDTLNCISRLLPANNESAEYLKRFKRMKSFTKSIFERKKIEFFSGSMPDTNRKSFLDLLLEIHLYNGDFTETDVVDELDTLLAAGHETTAVSMCWALYLIGLYNDVQQKIHEEIDFIFDNDMERPVTIEDIQDMKYLNCVLKESRRLYPSVPIFGREVENNINICGYYIPKGTMCVVPPYVVHRDKEVFPDPEEFNPDRFLPENSAKLPFCAYIPFALGPRNCIGKNFAILEETVVVSTILRHFTLESLDPRDRMVPLMEVSLQSSNPVRLKIRSRVK